jgi:hypothetical protein
MAAGELGRAVPEPVGQPGPLDHRGQPVRVRRGAGQRHRQRDVVPRGQRRHQVEGLEHEADPVPAQQRQLPVGQAT